MLSDSAGEEQSWQAVKQKKILFEPGTAFLAYELKQNTVASQLEAASNFNTSFADIEMLIAGDTNFSGLLIKGR